jgi:branched-chain amino acid transport system ATP-binding protein
MACGVAAGVPLLEVSHLSRSFGGLRALHDVSFSVEACTVVGLIGPNGAGKSTVFNLVAGALRPDNGRVVFDGRDITGVPTHRIARSGLARTFQLTRPFATLSVLDNVAVPALAPAHNNLAAARGAAEAILGLLGLTAWRDQPAEVLSTAGRKRLELARALALRPRMVLLDEVLAGLVPAERQRMVDVLRRLRDEGLTLLLVEHVMSAVMALSDHIVVLHHGELLSQGTPQEVAHDPRVIEAYLGDEPLP